MTVLGWRALCEVAKDGREMCGHGFCFWRDPDGTAWVVEVAPDGAAWTYHNPELRWNAPQKGRP